MPIQIVRNDITKMKVDVIVNSSNVTLSAGGGINGAIHKAGGPELTRACKKLGGCKVGEAKITRGYDLPARFVIHTVGLVWQGGNAGEEQQLAQCYKKALQLAIANGFESIAFPLISSGAFGYPKDKALKTAVSAIGDFLLHTDDQDLIVYLVVFDKSGYQISKKLFDRVEQYIDDNYALRYESTGRNRSARHLTLDSMDCSVFMAPAPAAPNAVKSKKAASLEEALKQIDESFSQMVLRKIKEKGMKNSECYKRANIDKKLFSKINNDIHYKPKKTTALALAVALRLPLDETNELLMKAGLALSPSEKFDIIVEYFIASGNYDIFEINEVMFFYDQPLLGGLY